MNWKWIALIGGVLAAAACMGDSELNDKPLGVSRSLDAAAAPRKVTAAPRDPGEVSRHDREDDCWLVLGGKVYDVTAFIPFHPGGSAILDGCGKDATKLFETRPMGSGTEHSSAARQLAGKYYIGDARQGR